MAKQPGEISARHAAKLMGIHINTMYAWARQTCVWEQTWRHYNKKAPPPPHGFTVRRDLTGHYWVLIQ